MIRSITTGLIAGMFFFASLPQTSNYILNNFSFGSGGGTNLSSSNYSLEGITGESNGSDSASSSYGSNPGFIQTEQEGEPTVSLSNPANYYDKLNFVISPPQDTACSNTSVTYTLEVSTTSIFTPVSTKYVQPDDTLSTTLTYPADYQTCTAWGGTTGASIIGLANNTTYYIRANATFGKYTQSPYGPSASAATVGQQLTYCLYVGSTCGSGSNSVSMGIMSPQNISTSSSNIGVNFSTNADEGGNVFIASQNGGLKSASANYLISSTTSNLSSASEGYGAEILSTTTGSGGPFTAESPYNGTGNNVGALNTGLTALFASPGPVTSASGALAIKALPSPTTPEATDYSDVLTIVSAAAF